MNRTARLLCYVSSILLVAIALQRNAVAQATQKVPVMDGGAGPCQVELTVNGTDGKPVYDATVKVHISYGFAGARRLDLQAGTNADGKLKFTGLPARVHHPPLEFVASKGDLEATLTYDPANECQGNHEITLEPPKATENLRSRSKWPKLTRRSPCIPVCGNALLHHI